MTNLQDVFNAIKEKQKKQKDINRTYHDALASSTQYQEIAGKFKTIKEKKKSIEQTIKNNFGHELDELEGIKLDIKTDKEMLSDIALTNLMKGKDVQVKDADDNEYEPIFSVNFKKTN